MRVRSPPPALDETARGRATRRCRVHVRRGRRSGCSAAHAGRAPPRSGRDEPPLHVVLMTLGSARSTAVCCCRSPPRSTRPGSARTTAATARRTAPRANLRVEDWGDPRYLAAVAQPRIAFAGEGVKISKLVLIGPSYAGYADAELVATHPELGPAALVVIDSYLDLPARCRATSPKLDTRKEIEQVLGGTLAQRPSAYAARWPSRRLDGLAEAMRHGMKLVDVWSVAPGGEARVRGRDLPAHGKRGVARPARDAARTAGHGLRDPDGARRRPAHVGRAPARSRRCAGALRDAAARARGHVPAEAPAARRQLVLVRAERRRGNGGQGWQRTRNPASGERLQEAPGGGAGWDGLRSAWR